MSFEKALLTVGGWFGSAIVSKLVDTSYSYLAEHMLPPNIESELRRLKAALPKITAVMGVGEALKLKHPDSGVDAWLAQFKEAFFAAEDVLDELKYWELADMVKNRDEVSGSSSLINIGSLKRKSTSSGISKDTLKRLREAVELLDLAATDVGNFLQLAIALDVNKPVYTSSRETTSLLTETKVFGREREKAIINDWLKKPASHNYISAFCIVGPGGLGKTTLAQLIFEEIKKDNHFDKTIWVCVSTSFSVQDITRNILQELGEKIDNNESLNRLQNNLKKKINSKKILFILDDVWNDDKMCDWEKLIFPLKCVQQGSKILLTTRMKSVADMLAHVIHVDPRENIVVLGGLKEQELLELFNKHAFNNYNSNNYKDLQNIGNDIVKKLRGSPLAAMVIGSLLNFNMDFHYWKRILNCDSLINLEQAKDVVDVLKLSYYHLPADVQECFRFCSIFPQDYKFNKDELIRMWMASGFIRQEFHAEDRQEDIGEEYFNHLLRKSFFERYPHDNNVYVMHDLLHDLAQNVSKGECFMVEPKSKTNIIPRTAQHVYVHESQIQWIFNLRNLRSLVITLSGERDNRDRDRFVLPNGSLKETLRLLVIRGRCELPEEFSHLIHLRFLKFTFDLPEYFIPKSIYELYHLQVLDLRRYDGDFARTNLETMGITNLVSLRYMDIPIDVMKNIHAVHKLTSLRKLNFFVGQECGHHIDELGTLNNLRSLSIHSIQNVGDPIEARKANLSKKESLITLSLNWSSLNWSSGINSDNHKQVIDNLQPHSNLKKLEIKYYRGHISPIWMMDSSHLYLSSLTLSCCHNWETLPFLGQIPHLKLLSLIHMNNVKEVDYSCDSTSDCAFPSLEKLNCVGMPKWESWAAAHISYGFPNLKELVIEYCPNLPKLPTIPSSLFKFEVRYMGINSLPDMHHGSSITAPAPSCMKSSLGVVDITGCPKLTSLNGFMQQENLDLQAVKDLTIAHCKNLVQLPTGAFGNFVSLKHLSIMDTPNLVIVHNQSILLPIKLESLKMGNCGELDVPLLELASQLPALTTLSIEDSEHITCIPSSKNAFTSLHKLKIKRCNKLIELSSMQQAHTVNPGDNMVSLEISILEIDHLCLLLIEPLKCLRFVSRLEVDNCSEMEALPEQWLLQNSSTLEILRIYDANSLRSLPDTMVMLTSLEELHIYEATSLEEIPELPASLIYKNITLDEVSTRTNLVSLRNSDNEGTVEKTGITNLVSLWYMDLPNQAMENIHGVHKLTSLRKIKFFIGQECDRHIDELGMLNNLQSLSIYNIENVGDPIEAKKANLSKKKSLITLSLNWSSRINSDNHDKQVIDYLQPHSNLKELEIRNYAGHISPIWMMNSSHLYLSSLTLFCCPNWETLPFLGQIPHLKLLSLFHMYNVKEVDYSCDSRSDCAFPSLEKLYCDCMPEWKSWAATHICCGFTNLKELVIKHCPNLPKLPAIPFSLFKFEVRSVGINSLPDMHHGSSITAPAPSCMKSSLRVVDITNCPKLTSLNGFMQQENLDLQAVEDLTIVRCRNLVQLPTGPFGNFVSLKHLYIMDIPNLVIVDNQSILLPSKLESLEMANCGELDVPLLESASQLPALATLYIGSSEHITCIPSSENAFTSLSKLKIFRCNKLIELSSMQQAHTINSGNNFVSLKISDLEIDHLCLLLIEPLKCLRFVSCLKVHNCSEMEALPEQWLLQNSSTLKKLTIYDANSLRSLPDAMVRLTSLKKLNIYKATLLEEIPEMPASLIYKNITP